MIPKIFVTYKKNAEQIKHSQGYIEEDQKELKNQFDKSEQMDGGPNATETKIGHKGTCITEKLEATESLIANKWRNKYQ